MIKRFINTLLRGNRVSDFSGESPVEVRLRTTHEFGNSKECKQFCTYLLTECMEPTNGFLSESNLQDVPDNEVEDYVDKDKIAVRVEQVFQRSDRGLDVSGRYIGHNFSEFFMLSRSKKHDSIYLTFVISRTVLEQYVFLRLVDLIQYDTLFYCCISDPLYTSNAQPKWQEAFNSPENAYSKNELAKKPVYAWSKETGQICLASSDLWLGRLFFEAIPGNKLMDNPRNLNLDFQEDGLVNVKMSDELIVTSDEQNQKQRIMLKETLNMPWPEV